MVLSFRLTFSTSCPACLAPSLNASAMLFVFLFGISAPAYGAAWLYSGIFKKFEPEVEVVSDMDFSVDVGERSEEINGEEE